MKGEIEMAEWRMTGTYFKSCNCDPGCPCDFSLCLRNDAGLIPTHINIGLYESQHHV